MDPSEHEKEKIERLRRAMYSRSLSGMLKEHPRHVLGQTPDQTEDDFQKRLEQEKEAQHEPLKQVVVAPRAIAFARTILWWLLGAAILFFVGAVSFFGYYFVSSGGFLGISPGNIDIAIAGPPQIEGGGITKFQITVTNRNKVPLESADLILTFPPGTRSAMDFVTDETTMRQSLGAIGPGEVRKGIIPVVFTGDEGTRASMKAELEYRVQGSSAIFVASTDYGVDLSSSPISLTIEGNKEAISGQPIELSVLVSSNTDVPVRDVLLKAQFPFGFKFSSASPAPASDGFWEVGDFLPGQKKLITIRGTLSGEQGDDRVFQLTAGTRRNSDVKTVETVLSKNSFPVAISKPFLGLTVALGGGKQAENVDQNPDSFVSTSDGGASLVVAPGDDVTVSITWQNNLPTAITDVVVAARLSGLAIDGSTVRTNDGFYRSTDNIVLWDKTTSNGALANLAPGERGVIGFSFKIPDSYALSGIVDPKLDISINAAGKRISEAGVPESLQSTVTKKVAVASDVGFAARGLYYANPFGSVGPMPPKAGVETTYAILFTVTNSTNKIQNAIATAHLPPYVRWIGIYSPASEEIHFNQTDGTVTWNLGDLEPGVGLNGSVPRQAIIAIGFTPSASQIGQEPSLLQNIQLTGIDTLKADVARKANPGAVITPEVLRKSKDITTNIQGDPGFSSANATVVK